MILYSDASILVVNKPAGLLSAQDGYRPDLPTVQTVLEPECGKLFRVHRLDKDTSGVLVLARTPEAHRMLDRQFARREVKKVYHALCIGAPAWQHITISTPLRVNGDRSHRTVVDRAAGKPAQTSLSLLAQYPGFFVVEARPATGYTHQIRAHLSSVGFPILGDSLYRLPPALKDRPFDMALFQSFPRTALHAAAITFTHPETQEIITFLAPDPPDFVEFVSTHSA